MIYMMTPSYDQPNKKKQPKRKQNNKKQTSRLPWKLMLSMLLVIILMLTAWIQEKSISGNQADEATIQDLEQLMNWSQELMDGGAMNGQWSFRWDATLLNGTMEEVADELFITPKGELLPRNIRQHGNAIDGQWQLPGSTIKLVRTEQDKIAEKVSIMLQVDSNELGKTSELKKYIQNLQRLLQSKDQNVQMNIKVFGQAKHKQALTDLKRLAVAQTIEEYADRGTNSVTFFSNQIKQYRWLSSGKMVNIQASLHKSSIDEQYTLTLGIPLISGEFGEILEQPSID